MSNLYEPPLWLTGYGTPLVSSAYRRAPLPFPGVGVGRTHGAVGLRAIGPYGQFTRMGQEGFPTSNICGSRYYLRQDSVVLKPNGFVFLTQFGISIWVGDGTIDSSHTYAVEYDYTFVDEPDDDYVDPDTGEHFPRWKDVIVDGKTVDIGGLGPSFGGYGKGPDLMEYPWHKYPPGGELFSLAKENGGQSNLTKPVNHAWFAQKLDQWEALPSTARRRCDTAGYYGSDFATSETIEGQFCYSTGGFVWCASDIAEDVGDGESFAKGWGGTVKVHVTKTERQNGPELRDTQNAVTEIFNKSLTEALLLDEITVGKWVDDYGTYDPEEPSAWNVGWKIAYVSEIFDAINVWKPIYGGAGKAQIRSADGGSYRVTFDIYGRATEEADHDTVIKSIIREITPAIPGEFQLDLADDGSSASRGQVSKIEKLTGEDYEEVPLDGAFGYFPRPGVRLFSLYKARRGKRKGIPSYDTASYPEDMPYGLDYCATVAFYNRQIFRENGHPTTGS